MTDILIQFHTHSRNFDNFFPFTFTTNLDYYFESFRPQYEQAAIIGAAWSSKCERDLDLFFNERKHLSRLQIDFGLNYIIRKNVHEEVPLVDSLIESEFPDPYKQLTEDFITKGLSKSLKWKSFTFNESEAPNARVAFNSGTGQEPSGRVRVPTGRIPQLPPGLRESRQAHHQCG